MWCVYEMMKDEIFEIMIDWNFWEKEIDCGIKRESYLDKLVELITKTNQIICISGIRRSGKSTIIKQIARQLIKDKKADILIINFEDERFLKRDVKLLIDIHKTYLEKIKPKTKPYIFLDEVQNVSEWERFARGMHERGDAKIIVSGSSSKLLSKELATLLTGRHITFPVYPLSLGEFLKFKKLEMNTEAAIIAKRTYIKQYLQEYFEFGGFPEVALSTEKKRILLSYFETMIIRDIIERYDIRDHEKIKILAKYYLTNVSAMLSFNKISGFLNIPLTTVERFSDYLETANIIFFLTKYSYKFKEQQKAQRKVYSTDVGLSNAVGFRFMPNRGKIMENVVAIELKRRQAFEPDMEIYYWKDFMEREVDFLIRKGINVSQLIQVCYDIANPQTKEREIRSLIRAMGEFSIGEGLIITDDFEGEDIIKGKKIIYIPLWKWMLI